MKNVQTICEDLKALDGAIGAFVCRSDKCLASSLPKSYDLARLGQVGGGLSRLGQLAQKAGYDRASSVFHWQKMSLFTWCLGENATLGMLALPTAGRAILELSVALAIEDLAPLVEAEAQLEVIPVQPAPSAQPSKAAPPPPPVRAATRSGTEGASSAEPLQSSPRLEELEELIVSELGPSGRALLHRARRQACKPGVPESTWLPALRALILPELTDACARATIAASVLWIPADSANG